eukprot:EG_transcript_7555
MPQPAEERRPLTAPGGGSHKFEKGHLQYNVSFADVVDLDDPEECDEPRCHTVRTLSVASMVSEKSLLHPSPAPPPGSGFSIGPSVYVMCIVSMLCQFSQTISEFVTWFLLEARGFAGTPYGAVHYYGLCVGITTFLPVLLGPVLGYASERLSVRRVLLCTLSISAVGLLVMAFTERAALYPLGVLLSSLQAIRPLRTSYIAAATAPSVRTQAMALQNLCTDHMRLVAILAAKLWGRYAPPPARPLVAAGLRFDALNLSLLTAFAATLLNCAVLLFWFREDPQAGGAQRARVEFTQFVKTTAPDGRVSTADSRQYAHRMLALLCAVAFLHQVSCGFYNVCNLPVLTQHFRFPPVQVQNAKLVQDVLPMPAPIFVAALSRYCQDRLLLLLGFAIALCGMMTYAWPPATSPVQPVLGITLLYWSQAFFFTSLFSLFSKVMGPMGTGARLACLASAAGFGSTCGTMGGPLVRAYGSWQFFFGVVPSLLALALVVNPLCFAHLVDDHPLVRQLLEQWRQDLAQAGHPRKASGAAPGPPP